MKRTHADLDLETQSDEEILVCAITHPSAFALLVDRYQEPFLRKAMGVIRNREDAEDIVQEAFTKIYMHAGSFERQEGASFKSWAYKILLNTAFTHYQKRKRERGVRTEIDPEIFEMMPDLSSRTFEKYGIADYIASVIARMPQELGRALELHFVEGRPQAEVAEIEGVSVGAIKTRIHRAKKIFRDVSASIS